MNRRSFFAKLAVLVAVMPFAWLSTNRRRFGYYKIHTFKLDGDQWKFASASYCDNLGKYFVEVRTDEGGHKVYQIG